MLLHAGLLAGSLLVLFLGAGWLVAGASRLAFRLKVSSLVVGLTVVAFGTSAPELVVSVTASLRDQADVAVANVVGSNIFNIAVILGLAAVIAPLTVRAGLVAREIPLMLGAMAVMALMAASGSIGRVSGAALLVAFGGFLAWTVIRARSETHPEHVDAPDASGGVWQDAAWVVAGLAALVAGAQGLVHAATAMARGFGVPELVIGVTLVAAGTSLPELATSALAAHRRQTDIAIGNVVGSNLFNALVVTGAAAVARPLPVSPGLVRLELPLMVGLGALLLPLAWTRGTIHRWEGALLLGTYVGFLAVLLL